MSENYSGFTSLQVEGNDVSYQVQRRKKRMMIVGVGVTVGCAMLLAFVMFGSTAAKNGLAALVAPGFSFGSGGSNSTDSWAVGTECEVDPCNGNGHCYVDSSGNKLGLFYYCACQEGWCGYDCEIGITSDQTCADVYAQEGSSTSSSSAGDRSSSTTSSTPGDPHTSSSTSSQGSATHVYTEAPASSTSATEAPATTSYVLP